MTNSATSTSGAAGASAAISLPKGGGAIRGIGETFQANPFTGTGNFSIPIFTSPGRNGFGPQLTLLYSSGNGNGPFGVGWQLSIPRITRKTEKGIPTYTDDDVFVMSGAEDLVPYLKKITEDKWEPDVFELLGYSITRYRPRTEGLFARIERWLKDGDVHWRATTQENVTSIYGLSPAARIADPDDSGRVHEWLIEETFDAKGNHIKYEYLQEDSLTLALPEMYERNRRFTQVYVRRILYGNVPDDLPIEKREHLPARDGLDHRSIASTATQSRRYVFEVLFDYADLPDPLPVHEASDSHAWWDRTNDMLSKAMLRDDRFSAYRAGFEIRTLRRCKRVLMLHHFKESGLVGAPLVKSTNFTYGQDPYAKFSVLSAVTVCGHRKDSLDPAQYLSRNLPPVTFVYSEFKPTEQRYQSVSAESHDYPPQALSDAHFTMLDVFGDGLPDIVSATNDRYYYWQNLGGARLDRRRSLSTMPAGVVFGDPGVSLGDMGGDGLPDLIVDAAPIAGFHEATSDGGWKPFRRFDRAPTFEFSDPNLRLVDLTGDGLSDMLVTRDSHFLWFRCLGETGYDDPKAIPRRHDMDSFPDVYFDDPDGRVRLADMSGDGLTDIVMVHDGRIEYWPNKGHGDWGGRIVMEHAPRIGFGFDPRRFFLVDLDGTGCADAVYVDFDRVHFWFNQSGNAFGPQQTIVGTPSTVDTTALQFADFFGTGTACLVWSYDYALGSGGNYKVLDFCGTHKPHLLIEMANGLGATTRAKYAASTKFYLEDKKNRRPWITNLPFPVQVLEKTETVDHIGKTKLVSTYTYHHGFYDGREREFRGFGRVDQLDTEEFAEFSRSGLHGGDESFANARQAFHVPPVLTRTWFHTGIYFDADRDIDFRELTEKYRDEYHQGDSQALLWPGPEFEGGTISSEACRALRGTSLRSEVYALDGDHTVLEPGDPYTVTENRPLVRQLQPTIEKSALSVGFFHGVFFTTTKETALYHYERNPADPRCQHTLTLEIDPFGNVLKEATIGYGRRHPDSSLPLQIDRDKQLKTLITYTEQRVTNPVDDVAMFPDAYRTPLPCESRTYELTGYTSTDPAGRFQSADFVRSAANGLTHVFDTEIGYEELPSTGKQRRLIEQSRTLYRPDDLGALQNDPLALLPLGTVQPLALPGESYKLAFTRGLLDRVYVRNGQTLLPTDPADVLAGGGADRGGYVELDSDDHWWIPADHVFLSPDGHDSAAQELAYARSHFFLPQRTRDPFHTDAVSTESFVTYDAYDLLMVDALDALGNRVTVGKRRLDGTIDPSEPRSDYRVLQPSQIMDPNRNRTKVAFDALGMVVGTAVMGKPEESLGDSLEGFTADLIESVTLDHLANPLIAPDVILARATTRVVYDTYAYWRTKDRPDAQPVVVYTLAREKHDADLQPGEEIHIQHSFAYSDGFGREIQKKIRAEPGPLVAGGAVINPRWVGSGWTVFNNKGKPVRKYEPFFSTTHRFEFAVEVGVSSILFYDPIQRVVAMLHPNHTYEKVVFDPWRKITWDVNDTALGDPRTDADIRSYTDSYFDTFPPTPAWETWYAQRQGGALGLQEQSAATRTAAHADTPTTAHFDTLGRPFVTLTDNGPDPAQPSQHALFVTRVDLDIEGNQRTVRDAVEQANDAQGRIVMRYAYDMAGNLIQQVSMEAGERWMLNDVMSNAILAWDSRSHGFRTEYDPLRRPLRALVTGADSDNPDEELLIERLVYGEQHPEAELRNLRGKLYLHLDQGGSVTTEAHDFKGNLLTASRRLTNGT